MANFETRLCERLKTIQNDSKNLGWGIADYSPLMKTDALDKTQFQFVVCVGHNFYRQVYFLFVEQFFDGHSRISILGENNRLDQIIACGTDDECIKAVIEKLRIWFPAIEVRVKGGFNDAKKNSGKGKSEFLTFN